MLSDAAWHGDQEGQFYWLVLHLTVSSHVVCGGVTPSRQYSHVVSGVKPSHQYSHVCGVTPSSQYNHVVCGVTPCCQVVGSIVELVSEEFPQSQIPLMGAGTM